MSDDIDDQLRRTMKVLDDQVPSGYFEGLPQRTLARLEDHGMQTSSDSSSNRISSPASVASVPPMSEKPRDEDSGLHDIRSLASSTKARLSSRRSTAHPIPSDDDIIASSSAGWKAVALPEPAKMVSLPELASLPSRAEVEAADRAARAQLKADLKTEKKAVAAPAVEAVAAAPAASMASAPSFGARIATKPKRGKGAMIALVGVGVAAAAGAAIYFATANKEKAPVTAAVEARPLPQAPELASLKKEMPAPAPTPVEPPPVAPAVEAVAAAVPAATEEPEEPEAKTARKEPKEKVHKVEIRGTAGDTTPAKPAAPAVKEKEEVKKGGEQEPSFDALLKEAGVSDQKKEAKPVLDKKSLTGADIKTGMGSVQSKAMACYAGTQGTAAVKLTVAPSGKVSKVHVTGVFANTPVASCVENAVKSATFPPWDGGPQSIAYSYLLAE